MGVILAGFGQLATSSGNGNRATSVLHYYPTGNPNYDRVDEVKLEEAND